MTTVNREKNTHIVFVFIRQAKVIYRNSLFNCTIIRPFISTVYIKCIHTQHTHTLFLSLTLLGSRPMFIVDKFALASLAQPLLAILIPPHHCHQPPPYPPHPILCTIFPLLPTTPHHPSLHLAHSV